MKPLDPAVVKLLIVNNRTIATTPAVCEHSCTGPIGHESQFPEVSPFPFLKQTSCVCLWDIPVQLSTFKAIALKLAKVISVMMMLPCFPLCSPSHTVSNYSVIILSASKAYTRGQR